MMISGARLPILLGAFVLFLLGIAMPFACAQQAGPIDPDAKAVKEDQLLQQTPRIEGQISIPATRENVLEQPFGRDWTHYRMGVLPWIGGIVILGTLAGLVAFYLWRGKVRIKKGRSGRKIVRFNGFERFVHWMTAVCFIILGLTGLNISFGRALLLPLMGPDAFTTWSAYAKHAHNFLSFPFTLGVLLIFVMWLAGNIPNRVDVQWFKRGGGIVGHDQPPAERFNGGQKAVYWMVVLAGVAMIVSGYVLIFPFYGGTNIFHMQLAQMVHAVVAMLFVAGILGHIYIGTIGMEGAFEAMGEGTVDVNWAEEHHSLWLEEARREQDRGAVPPRTAAAPPAE
jgi:formate dehydrogenase subunit gamma